MCLVRVCSKAKVYNNIKTYLCGESLFIACVSSNNTIYLFDEASVFSKRNIFMLGEGMF